MIKKLIISAAVGLLPLHAMETKQSPASSHSQIIGTQAIPGDRQPKYKDVVAQAEQISQMGSKIIKINVSQVNESQLNKILNMDFDTFFFWWHSTSDTWKDGFSKEAQQKEYEETKKFAEHLLTHPKNKDRKFFIGHWEGDWYLTAENTLKEDNENHLKQIEKRTEGMIQWLNTRQKAVDEARNQVGRNTQAEIYHYTEVNRVIDAQGFRAIVKNFDSFDGYARQQPVKKYRLVDAVLPHVNVDYVSYSAYDVQRENVTNITQSLNYIASKLQKKDSVQGFRVFIGECAIPVRNDSFKVIYSPEAHEETNREIFTKFLQTNVPYILYWELYNNEYNEQLVPKGYWLIDDDGQKQPLYYTLTELYKAQKGFKDIRNETLNWLKNKSKSLHTNAGPMNAAEGDKFIQTLKTWEYKFKLDRNANTEAKDSIIALIIEKMESGELPTEKRFDSNLGKEGSKQIVEIVKDLLKSVFNSYPNVPNQQQDPQGLFKKVMDYYAGTAG